MSAKPEVIEVHCMMHLEPLVLILQMQSMGTGNLVKISKTHTNAEGSVATY